MQLLTWIVLLVATLLCAAEGHPTPDNNEAITRSVKTSSGRKAFEAESSSSRTELENDGNDFSHFSEYQATAAESNHSEKESEFTLDSNNGDMSVMQSNTHSESSSSKFAESSKTEVDEDLFDDHFNSLDDEFSLSRSSNYEKSEKSSSSYKSDSEMKSMVDLDGDSNNVEKIQQKSSSFAEEKEFESENKQSSFVSRDLDHDFGKNEFGLENDFNGKQIPIKESPEDLTDEIQNKVEESTNISASESGVEKDSKAEQITVKESIEGLNKESQKVEESVKAIETGSTVPGIDTSMGIPEILPKKETVSRKSTSAKKSTQNAESKSSKLDKQVKTSQKTPGAVKPKKPSKSKSLPQENKPTEKITDEIENEIKSTTGKTKISPLTSQPLEKIESVSENEIKVSSDTASSTLEKVDSSSVTAETLENTTISPNTIDLKQLPSLSQNEKPLLDTLVPSTCNTSLENVINLPQGEKPLLDTPISSIYNTPQENIVQVKEEQKSLTADAKSVESENINVLNNVPQVIQAEKVTEKTSTLLDTGKIGTLTPDVISNIPGITTPSVPTTLPSPSLELLPPLLTPPPCAQTPVPPSISAPIPPSVSNSLQTTSVSGNQQISEINAQSVIPTTGLPTVSDVTQATSVSESQQIMETNTQYNASPELYSPYLSQDYGTSYGSPYPMYPYEKSPFLAPPIQFPHGQSTYPPYFSQSPNMNHCNFYPFNLYGGCMPQYPLYAYPPYPQSMYDFYRCNPSLPTRYMDYPERQYPEYVRPPTSYLPKQNVAPSTPVIPTVVPSQNNSPTSSQIPSVAVAESVSADILVDQKQRDLDIVESSPISPISTIPENPLTIPDLPQLPCESLIPETSLTNPLLPQQPCDSTTPAVLPSIPELTPKPLSPSQELMVKNHIPPYVIEDLERRFEEAKIEILQKYTVFPEDMTQVIETVEEQSLSYEYIILGTQAGGLSALKALTESGKRVLILDDARLPPSETYSAYHRPGLVSSPYITSYPAKVPKLDIEKKIYASKVVGGTLCYDSGVWDHGSLQKFKQWSETCKLWSYDKVSSYYADIENVEEIGYLNGPINIVNNIPDSTLNHQIIESFREAGLQEVKYDIESARKGPGLMLLPTMHDSKSTLSFAERMFAEVKNKENLHMALGVQPVKIIFESDRAVAVEVVTTSGKTLQIRVTEEVIVAYGVVNTVKLLQQSGFGDASLLQQYQIPVLRDLPLLGKEVLLNPMYPGVFIKCQRGSLLEDSDSDFSAMGYAFKETSMQTSVASSLYKAFLQVQGTSEPNIQINIFTFSSKTMERLMSFMNGVFSFNEETIKFVLEEISDHDIMFLVPQLLDLEVRAEVSISGADYKSTPMIDTHLFESDNDMLAMIRTLAIIRRVSKSSVFKDIGADLVQIPVGKCGPAKFSKDFNECSIRELTVASINLQGGAMMGIDSSSSVVDERLRLHGTQNCRLLSSAIIPNGISSDSSAISAVIGRYGADMITKNI